MEEKNEDSLKELIRSELVKTKEDIHRSIINSVKILKEFIIIEEGSGKVLILNQKSIKNIDKIILLLIGKYLAFISGILTQPEVPLSTLELELGIPKTTLSGPLSSLVTQNTIKKPKENSYKINEVKIEEEVNRICNFKNVKN